MAICCSVREHRIFAQQVKIGHGRAPIFHIIVHIILHTIVHITVSKVLNKLCYFFLSFHKLHSGRCRYTYVMACRTSCRSIHRMPSTDSSSVTRSSTSANYAMPPMPWELNALSPSCTPSRFRIFLSPCSCFTDDFNLLQSSM